MLELSKIYIKEIKRAGVAELVDALGLGPSAIWRGGSNPLSGTTQIKLWEY